MFVGCEERTSKSAETKHGKSSALFLNFSSSAGSPALYPLRVSVGMKARALTN
jgi:hypothetical protein